MKILIACEESQTVCKAFRAKGHEAYSCDILPCSGGRPEWHIQGDVLPLLEKEWDLIIAHPPCTYLTHFQARWYHHDDDKDLPREQQRPHPKFPNRQIDQDNAIEFFLKFKNARCPRICIENPRPESRVVEKIGKYSQMIQPYQFGHGETKLTCLWLKNLPNLIPTKIIPKEERKHSIWALPPSKDRAKLRSKTFQGIADAMAEQWGNLSTSPK